jgi:histidine triad (HIT) family protein
MECEYCELQGRETDILYQDEHLVAALKDKVIAPGQITIFPKKHLAILEMLPSDLLQKCVHVANKVSIAAFETLGAQGTNLIVRNGLGAGQNVPHFGIEIIPRQENDGLGLQWEPRPLPEDEMAIAFDALTKEVSKMGNEPEVKEETVESTPKKGGKSNYLLKSLNRIP